MNWDWVVLLVMIWCASVLWRKRDEIKAEWTKVRAGHAAKGDEKVRGQLLADIEAIRKDRGLPPRPLQSKVVSIPPEPSRDEVRRPPTNTVRGGRAMLPQDIERAWSSGDYDLARGALQKYAYGMVGPGVAEDDKQRFRQLMAEFALDDPLYRDVMARLKPIVLSKPGILQSAIYAYFPEYDQETVRYVAYFGHEIGDIHRRKKGRSYELLPPGEVIDMPE